jgi:replicative DNA helicase
LDFVLDGGFQAGELVYLGSRPGVGKTTLALQVARSVAKTGQGVLVVSREMTKTQLTRRMLSQESQVMAASIKTGLLSEGERKMMEYGANVLRGLPIWLTTSIQNTAEVEDALNTFAPGTLGLLVVDYLQLLHGPKDVRDRRLQVEYVSQALKGIAIRHEIPVLCLSSLSRPPTDASKHWRPALSSLRESGELEHDADIVLLAHRETDAETMELIVAKNRDGRVGTCYFNFDDSRLTFTEGNKTDGKVNE